MGAYVREEEDEMDPKEENRNSWQPKCVNGK